MIKKKISVPVPRSMHEIHIGMMHGYRKSLGLEPLLSSRELELQKVFVMSAAEAIGIRDYALARKFANGLIDHGMRCMVYAAIDHSLDNPGYGPFVATGLDDLANIYRKRPKYVPSKELPNIQF